MSPSNHAKKAKPIQSAEQPQRSPINITSQEAAMLQDRAAACGLTMGEFVRQTALDFAGRLDPARLLSTPCPCCRNTDRLQIIAWSNERPDGSEYNGDAVRCLRCDAIAPIASWSLLDPIWEPANAGKRFKSKDMLPTVPSFPVS